MCIRNGQQMVNPANLAVDGGAQGRAGRRKTAISTGVLGPVACGGFAQASALRWLRRHAPRNDRVGPRSNVAKQSQLCGAGMDGNLRSELELGKRDADFAFAKTKPICPDGPGPRSPKSVVRGRTTCEAASCGVTKHRAWCAKTKPILAGRTWRQVFGRKRVMR